MSVAGREGHDSAAHMILDAQRKPDPIVGEVWLAQCSCGWSSFWRWGSDAAYASWLRHRRLSRRCREGVQRVRRRAVPVGWRHRMRGDMTETTTTEGT